MLRKDVRQCCLHPKNRTYIGSAQDISTTEKNKHPYVMISPLLREIRKTIINSIFEKVQINMMYGNLPYRIFELIHVPCKHNALK